MTAIICTLSPARLEMLESDPDVLDDLLESRDEVPGLLDLDKTWDALDLLLSDRGKEPVLGDAILGRSGKKMKAEAGFGNARLVSPDRVKAINEALKQLPRDHIRKNFPRLSGLEVHGDYGLEVSPNFQAEEIAELSDMLVKIRGLYEQAAKEGKSMMMVIV